MPAVSAKQRRLMGADLARKRKGQHVVTGLSEGQLRKFAKKPRDKKK